MRLGSETDGRPDRSTVRTFSDGVEQLSSKKLSGVKVHEIAGILA
jgi:hypothetical protein